jgi:alpha-1,2-mannosyltransferase
VTGGADAGRTRSTREIVLLAVLGAASLAWLTAEVWHVTWGLEQLDFAVYVLGAHHVVDGHLYSVTLPDVPRLPFTYPPVSALAFVPLTVLPRQAAQSVWAVVNVASLYGIILLSLRAVRPGMDRTGLLLWSLVLLGPSFLLDPVRLDFYFGQVNLVLVALILVDLTTTVRLGRRALPRGVLVGLTAAVKLVPLVFVPFLFVTGRTRAAVTSVVTFAVATLLAAAVDPAVSWSYWTRYATDASRVGDPAFYLNQSLLAAVDRYEHRLVSPIAVDGVAVLVLVAGIALARWAWRDSSPFLGILVSAATGMVVSPITWEHHMVWCVPIVLWLAVAPDRPAGGPLYAAAGALVLWWAPINHVPSAPGAQFTEHGWTLVAGDAFFALTVLFLVGIAVLLTVRRGRRRRTPGLSAPRSPTTSTAATT